MKECLFNTHFMLILVLLLLQSGDVEINPGPAAPYHGSLSILHSNIRSVRNMLDYIKEQFFDFNIICLTETHLDVSVSKRVFYLRTLIRLTERIVQTMAVG